MSKEAKKKTVRAWAVIRDGKKVNDFYGGLKVNFYGVVGIPNLAIFPKTKRGRRFAIGDTNGYEKVIPIEITYKLTKGK